MADIGGSVAPIYTALDEGDDGVLQARREVRPAPLANSTSHWLTSTAFVNEYDWSTPLRIIWLLIT